MHTRRSSQVLPMLWMMLRLVVSKDKPNIILFLADDMGYGDLSVYGHPSQEFGPIDQLAVEGLRFTQWYAPAVLCTPSRAAMMTGRYTVRYDLSGGVGVFIPPSSEGLPKEEVTLAEALREEGYTTGIVGKWHLGINQHDYRDGNHLPYHHGFDYVGHILPFSLSYYCEQKNGVPPWRENCFLYKNDTIVQQPIDLDHLSTTLLHDAQAFIHDSSDKLFFLYFGLTQTHTPIHFHPRFNGSSRRGPYGDMMNEMSWAVGEIMSTLKQLNLDRDTLTIFLSDHGPHIERCLEGGSAGPFKGGKLTYYEGGLRVPAIFHWPGRIESGRVSGELASTLDVFPTLVQLVGGNLRKMVTLDGQDISNHILSVKAGNSHTNSDQPDRKPMLFFCGHTLATIRYKQYKIHRITAPLFKDNPSNDNFCPEGHAIADMYTATFCRDFKVLDSPLIFDVEQDPEERYPLREDKHTDLLKEIGLYLIQFNQTWTIGDGRTDFDKTSLALKPCCNPPYCFCR